MYDRVVLPVDAFIADITHAIWNGPGRDPGLCERWYGSTAAIHTDAGDITGGPAVCANTRERLAAFPDFHGTIDDTIWAGDAARGFRTSMRWTWTGTHRGPSAFGPATGAAVRFQAIADCVVRDGVIVEEWLASNPLALARQLGLDDAAAVALRPTPPVSPVPPGPGAVPEGPARLVAEAIAAGVGGADVTPAYAEGARVALGPDRTAAPGWLAGWARVLGYAAVRVDDALALPGPGVDRVATRWTVLGPAGPVVTAISHHHVHAGRIVAEWTHYDEIAVLARAGGLP